jgi:hypothetical protein
LIDVKNVALKAHYDGTQILLDEPAELQPNTKLLITVIESPEAEREAFMNFSLQDLNAAYNDDEPDYASAQSLPLGISDCYRT